MLSTLQSKFFAKLSNRINENLKNGNIGQNWTNFDKRPNNESNYLVFCDNLEQRVDEIKNNPWKLQEQCYINDTMKKVLGLSANEKEVLGAIYGVTHDSGVGYLTNKYIAKSTDLSKRTIIYFLKKFEKLGLIVRKYERNGMKVTRNYSFTETFFKVSELSGNKCIKRPEAKPEVNECQNLHEMSASPVSTQVQSLHINNTSIIDNNIPKSILLSNKVNISINTYTKVNSRNSKTEVEPKKKLVSYNELINNFVDLNYQEGQEELKKSLKRRLQVIYGTRRNLKKYKGTKLKLTNKELKSTLDKLLELSKGNAGKALTIVEYSNTQYYSDLYEPNQKTCIAYKDKAYSSLIRKVDYINSKLDFNNPRYEENLKLKYKCLNRLSTWYKVRNNLLPTMRPVYDGTKDFEEVDNAYSIFTSVNEELKNNGLTQMDEQKKYKDYLKNCQGVGDPLYNFEGSQRMTNNVHLVKTKSNTSNDIVPCEGSYECYETKYEPEQAKIKLVDGNPNYKANPVSTYDLGYYERLSLSNLGIDIQVAYDTSNIICNQETTIKPGMTYSEPRTKEEISTNEIIAPPPNSGGPPSPHVNERIKRGDLGGKQRAKIKKCKFILPGGKSGLNELKSGQNEKEVKRDESDLEFIKKCLERAKEVLLN